MSFARLPARKGYTFIRKHEMQEEIYIILNGKGVIYLDKKLIELLSGDIVRVNPEVNRALKADNKIELVYLILSAIPVEDFPKKKDNHGALIDDGIPNWDELPPWYKDNKKVIEINKKIRSQRESEIS